MCSAQKCTFWQRGAEPTTCKGPERLLRTSAADLDVPTTYHKSRAFLVSSSLCHVLCECHNKAGVGTNVDIRSSNLFLGQRICLHSDTHRRVKVTGKGATTTLPIPSPSHPCSRRRDRRSKLRKARRTKHENKESISNYRYSCRC